jgi:type I restriction enzyme S subunit
VELTKDFKKTEVGVIPNGWSVAAIGDVCDIKVGRDLYGDRYSEISDNNFKYPIFSNTVSDYGLYGYYNFPEYEGEAVTVVGRGVGLGCAFPRSGGFGAIGRLLVLFPNKTVKNRFLSSYINNRITIFNESGGIPQLTGISFSKYKVPVPPVKEQEAIANALSDADAYIESLEKLIEKKRLIKKGAMQELLAGKRRLPGFNGSWRVLGFDEVFVRLNVKRHQIDASKYVSSGSLPIIDQGKSPIVAYTDCVEKVFSCPPNGVIVFGDHTCIVKFVDFNFVVGADGTQVLQAKNGHDTFFYSKLLEFNGVEPTGYNRHFKILREKTFLAPDHREQIAISGIFADLDHEIQVIEAKLTKARLIKQGMMQELLTGRIRLV